MRDTCKLIKPCQWACLFSLLAILLLTLPFSRAGESATEKNLAQQRSDFKAARSALKKDQRSRFKRLAKNLKDYPLYPYLEYWDLNRNMNPNSGEQIQAFLNQYADTPIAPRLRSRWLQKLAKWGEWQQYLDAYQPDSSTRAECLNRRALYKTGNKQAAFANIETIWLKGRSQPRACDPLFAAWRDAGLMTEELVWQRIHLAMKNRQVYLARYLERFLNSEDRKWVQLWRKIHRNPDTLISEKRLQPDTEMTRTIIVHGVKRMARRNPLKAAEVWDKQVMDHAFDDNQFADAESYIAVELARKNAPEAMHWLANLSGDENKAVREWRILTSINQDNWEDALYWMNQLSFEEQRQHRWRYWRARALEATGKPNRARVNYAVVAQKRDYYGFLSADRINIAYDFEDKPLSFPATELAQQASLPGMLRAHEFYNIGDTLNARREFYFSTKSAAADELLKAAALAHQWGWHDRAILALGQAKYYDDLEMRFPLAHHEQVTFQSETQQIDPSWAYAVMRQESAFATDARSPKGAMGLMQIMPRTGRSIARDLDTHLKHSHQLLDANTNIRFGISYLKKVMNRFDQNTVLATAAYNAGSQRVKSWLPEDKNISPDRWIENIPFKETRNYLKQVLAFTAIYDERMKRPVTPLKLRMPEIQPTIQAQQTSSPS